MDGWYAETTEVAMDMQSTTDTTHRVRVWSPGTAAVAGVAGPVLFVLGVITQQVHRGPGYSPAGQQISDLTAGGAGWAQQLNFVVFGLLLIASAAGLHRGIAPTRSGVVGPALLALNGLQLIIAGVFALRQTASDMVFDPTGVHSTNGAVFFVGLGVPLIVLALRLRRDPRWCRLAGYVLGTGIVLVVAVGLDVMLVRPAGSALHPWLGSAQRVIVLIWLACVLALALRLRGISTADQAAPRRVEAAPWVRRFAIATAVIFGLIGVMMFFGGQHGPAMHGSGMPGMRAGGAGTIPVGIDGGRR